MARNRPEGREPRIDPADRVALARRIQEARIAAGYATASEAAARAGIDQWQWYHYEGARRNPTYATLNEMIWRLGLDPKILFGPLTATEREEAGAPEPGRGPTGPPA